jgi:hypothetical protein
MRHLGKLIALTAVALTFTASPVAQAEPVVNTHSVDIIIDFSDFTCTWTGVPVGGTPPGPALLNPSSYTGSCDNGAVCTLESFTVMFDDANGTATIDNLAFTCTGQFSISCGYRATNVVLARTGTTREYIGNFTATRYSGSMFCPSTQFGTIRLIFH